MFILFSLLYIYIFIRGVKRSLTLNSESLVNEFQRFPGMTVVGNRLKSEDEVK